MTKKIILQAVCGLLVMISIVFIIHVSAQPDLNAGITILGKTIPLKIAEVLFVIYYLICLTLFVKSYFTD